MTKDNRSARSVSLRSWILLAALPLVGIAVASLDAFAHPFAYIANINSGSVSVIDTASNTVVKTLSGVQTPWGAAVNPAGTRAFVANESGSTITVIETLTHTVLRTVTVGRNPSSVAIHPTGHRVYVSNYTDGTISVLDASLGAFNLIKTTTVGTHPFGVAVHPAGHLLYVANAGSNTLSVMNTSDNNVIKTVAIPGEPTGVAVHPAGTRVYVTNYTGNSVSVVETSNHTVIATEPVGANPFGVAVNPAGTRVFVANHSSNSVSVMDTGTNKVAKTIPLAGGARGIAVHPSGTRIYVTIPGLSKVAVLDASTGDSITTIDVGQSPGAMGLWIGPDTGSPSGPAWAQIFPSGPLPDGRQAASGAYDQATDTLIVFGGLKLPTTYLNDTWILKNASGAAGTPQWMRLQPSGSLPGPRQAHNTAYDPSTNRMILFGGAISHNIPYVGYNDVWVLTNANGTGGNSEWIQLQPQRNIPALAWNTGFYDPGSNRLIVFGGILVPGDLKTNDVWVLSNANGIGGVPTWTQLNIAGDKPVIRDSHSGVYDSRTNRLVVFGGHTFPQGPISSGTVSNDVWVLSNANGVGGPATWTLRNAGPTSPTPRQAHRAVYDSSTDTMLILGGSLTTDGTPHLNEVWALANPADINRPTAWTLLAPGAGPSPRTVPAVGYNNSTRRLIVFSGLIGPGNAPNDTWALSNANPFGDLMSAWTKLSPLGLLPDGREASSGVYDSVKDTLIVFGGQKPGGTYLNDTWILRNATGAEGAPQWLQLNPGGTLPGRRQGHSAVYDPNTNRMIVFGGAISHSPYVSYNDTWVLTSANGTGGNPEWIRLNPVGSIPQPLGWHTAGHDPSSNRIIVFGGLFVPGNTTTNNVWVLSNANGIGGIPTWTQLNIAGNKPVIRQLSAGIYDTRTNRMVVFAGSSSGPGGTDALLNDVWILNNANGLGGAPTWTLRNPGPLTPAPRQHHRTVYDPSNDTMLVFAGALSRDGNTLTDEVWALANATDASAATAWTLLKPGAGPAARALSAVGYNTAREQLVVFSGYIAGSIAPNDTWLLSNANPFPPKPPVLAELQPSMGSVGSPVKVTGSGFGQGQGKGSVNFGPTTMPVQTWNDTLIEALVPDLGANNYDVSVTTDTGLKSNSLPFTIPQVVQPPSITKLEPASGVVGATVKIIGENFGAKLLNARVLMGLQAMSINSWVDGLIEAIVPDLQPQSWDVMVITASGKTSNPKPFTIVKPDPPTVAHLNQTRVSGTNIPEGGVTTEKQVTLMATVTDPGGQEVRLQVEVRPSDQQFTGDYTHRSGPTTSGSQGHVVVTGLVQGISYHWRARGENARGDVSLTWTQMGGSSDFVVVPKVVLIPGFGGSILDNDAREDCLNTFFPGGLTSWARSLSMVVSAVVWEMKMAYPAGEFQTLTARPR